MDEEDEVSFALNKESAAILVAKVPNEELRKALEVVMKHLNKNGAQGRNETTWGLFDDKETSLGLIFGIYRY